MDFVPDVISYIMAISAWVGDNRLDVEEEPLRTLIDPSLFDVGEGAVDMGDLSLNNLLRRAESLVEDLIGYFKSGMLKKGQPFEHLTNFDIINCELHTVLYYQVVA